MPLEFDVVYNCDTIISFDDLMDARLHAQFVSSKTNGVIEVFIGDDIDSVWLKGERLASVMV